MNGYETSGIVEELGQVHLAGVPLALGTEIEITIIAKRQSEDAGSRSLDEEITGARESMRELFRTVKGCRMAPKFSRDELYNRQSFR